MESSLKDPFSVMYRNVKAIKVVFPGYEKEFFYFCGEINAKNSYGGYAGFKPFFSQGGKIQIGRDNFPGWKPLNKVFYKLDPVSDYCFYSGLDIEIKNP
jgi:hypothetical protein